MEGIKLYKLLATEDNEYEQALADEIRWVSDDELFVWVPYMWIEEFMESMKSMFGIGMFDDGGFDGNFQSDGVCIDLEKMIYGYGVDLKEVFPLDKYRD